MGSSIFLIIGSESSEIGKKKNRQKRVFIAFKDKNFLTFPHIPTLVNQICFQQFFSSSLNFKHFEK